MQKPNPTISLKDRMQAVSDEIGYPRHFKSDLDVDFNLVEKYHGSQMIWLLREHGTVMVPLKMGVDPVMITGWMEKGNTFPFLVDTSSGEVTPLSAQEAIEVVNKPPIELNREASKENLIEKVNGILEKGCENGIWGLFQKPIFDEFETWSAWLAYFRSTNNAVMIDFMAKAIRLLSIR